MMSVRNHKGVAAATIRPSTPEVRPTRSAAFRIAAASIMALSLAGCRPGASEPIPMGFTLPDSAQRHPILVSEQPVHMDVSAARGSSGMSPAQVASVQDFVATYRTQGTGKLFVSTPSGGSNEGSAFQVTSELRSLIGRAGIPSHLVKVSAYHDGSMSQPPVKLSFVRYAAQGPNCGNWSENLAESDRNDNHPNFGCAQQHNLAAMIANPRDLVVPRTETPRPADRRDVTYRKYVAGESTNANKSSEEKAGNISEVAKQ